MSDADPFRTLFVELPAAAFDAGSSIGDPTADHMHDGVVVLLTSLARAGHS